MSEKVRRRFVRKDPTKKVQWRRPNKEGLTKKVRRRRFVEEGVSKNVPSEKILQRRSDEEGQPKKVYQRRSDGGGSPEKMTIEEDLTEKVRFRRRRSDSEGEDPSKKMAVGKEGSLQN